MLIAMFSRSFDLMYDAMTIHVQTNYARAVVAWCASTPEPPPLNLLQVPYKLVRLFLSMLRSLRCKGSARRETADAINVTLAAAPSATASATLSPADPASDAIAAAAKAPASPTAIRSGSADRSAATSPRFEGGLGRLLRNTHGTFSGLGLETAVHWLLRDENGATREEPRDYEGTTVRSVVGVRNSWEIWKEKVRVWAVWLRRRYDSHAHEHACGSLLPWISLAQMSEEQLAHEVADFAAKREDTLAQEERWRNKMMRRLGDKFDHVDARLDRMNERFEQLASACVEIKESVNNLQQTMVARDQPVAG